jgi:tetratricopeptide (TPR) repeat protein
VLAETKALRDKARREVEDPAAWHDALAALERAEGQGPADQVETLRDEIQAGLDGAERDAWLRQTLVEVRANKDDVGAEGTDAAYATAFRLAEMDVDALEPAELARRLLLRRREAVVIELSAFLDDWSAVRRETSRPVTAWRKPMEAARLVDRDPYRDRLRKALLAEDRKPQTEALEALAAAPEASELPAPTAVLLGNTLADLGHVEAAVALLRQAAGRHPGDVWVNYDLAGALERLRPAARDEAVRYYTAARALRPETAHVFAHLLDRMGRGAEAEAVFRDLANRRPDVLSNMVCLAVQLKHNGRAAEAATILERAVAAAREAIRLRRDDFKAHFSIGLGLCDVKGDYAGAEAEFREAIRLGPDIAVTHFNLGNALSKQGKLPEAIAAYREAIRLEPATDAYHYSLGAALGDQGKTSEAIAAYREAIRLMPDHAAAHLSLGVILCDQRHDYAGAETEFREAIRLTPDHALAHFNLGNALRGQEKQLEAIAAYREAIRFKPDHAEAYCNLGARLQGQGQFREALASIRRGHELGSKQPGWRYPSAGWVLQAERFAALEADLPAVIRRERKPKDPAEGIVFAEMAYKTKQFGASARLCAESFGRDAKLAEDPKTGNRYDAARAAAQAGAGKGQDNPKPDGAERSKLRGQALDWLKAELVAWSKAVDSGDAGARRVVAARLRRWKSDPDLASVRDRNAIEKLPADEQRAWEALWKDVDALLNRQ